MFIINLNERDKYFWNASKITPFCRRVNRAETSALPTCQSNFVRTPAGREFVISRSVRSAELKP
jgi:hypothetical protein